MTADTQTRVGKDGIAGWNFMKILSISIVADGLCWILAPVTAAGRYLVINMKYPTSFVSRKQQRILRTSRVRPIMLAVTMAALAFSAQRVRGQVKPNVGLINPAGVAFDVATGKAYTVDSRRGAVDISDDVTGSTVHLKVGAGPVSIAVNGANGMVYVANGDDGTVSVIDGKTDQVLTTVPATKHPYAIAANSTTGKVYVSRTYGDAITVIDGTTNRSTDITMGSPDFIAVDAMRDKIYLLGYEGGTVTVIDGSGGELHTRQAGMHAWSIAVNEITGVVYVPKPGDAKVVAFSDGSASSTEIASGEIPCAVAINTRTNMVYVANYGSNSVTVIDGAQGKAVATVPVGDRPEAIAVDATNNLIYVANTHGNSVSVLDGGSNHVLVTLAAGKNPYALAVNPGAGLLHVANLDAKSFTIVDVKHVREHAR
jgi:YVTN family beta-propeller protein